MTQITFSVGNDKREIGKTKQQTSNCNNRDKLIGGSRVICEICEICGNRMELGT
jgi:hypothetical protein